MNLGIIIIMVEEFTQSETVFKELEIYFIHISLVLKLSHLDYAFVYSLLVDRSFYSDLQR